MFGVFGKLKNVKLKLSGNCARCKDGHCFHDSHGYHLDELPISDKKVNQILQQEDDIQSLIRDVNYLQSKSYSKRNSGGGGYTYTILTDKSEVIDEQIEEKCYIDTTESKSDLAMLRNTRLKRRK